LLQQRVGPKFVVRDAIESWSSKHADVEVSVSKPLDSLLCVPYCAEDEFCIEVVDQLGYVLTLNG
jgi:hypothetical protein